MKQTIQFHCPLCGLTYQESQGVEIVNKFGFSKPDKFKDKECKECSGKLNDSK